MNFTFTNNGNNIVLPKDPLLSKINSASESEIKILLYAASVAAEKKTFNESDVQKASSLDLTDVIIALQFWRGAGILTTEGTAESQIASTNTKPNEQEATADKPKLLQKDELPTYSGEEIARLFDTTPELEMLIDECNNIAGKILNTYEINKIVALYDYLTLSSEYIISVYDYCKSKKNKTTIHYLEKTIFNLIDEGVDTDEKLREYLKNKEEYESFAGQIRKIFGAGTRSFSKREKELVESWAQTKKYSFALIEYAYEKTINSTAKPSIPYAGRILENWEKAGITTVEQAIEEEFTFKKSKEAEKNQTASSFDDDEFFNAALKKSYEGIGKKPNS